MINHICKLCNYATSNLALYIRHTKTQKHKNNILLNKNTVDVSGNTIIIEKIDNLAKQNEELKKKIELLEKSNQELKEVSNENTHKIVKEARVIKKSILSMLNTDYKDTPSIDYIKEDEFRIEFEEEYNFKIDDKDNRLFMRIFSDYKKRKLIDSLCNVIVRIIKK